MNPSQARSKSRDAEIQTLRRHNLRIQKELKLTQKRQAQQVWQLQVQLKQTQKELEQLENHKLWRLWQWGRSLPWQQGIIISLVVLTGLGTSFALTRRQQTPVTLPPALLPQPLALFTFPTIFQLSPSSQPNPTTFEYNVAPPDFYANPSLQTLVDELVALAQRKGMPTHALSITLVDVVTQEIAGYQENQLRYPASVMKLFWLVASSGRIAQGGGEEEEKFAEDLYRMIRHSDNEATSRIMDAVTETKSGGLLRGQAYRTWREKRQQANTFFHQAGYTDLDIAQKAYPFGGYHSPRGRDWQLQTYGPRFVRNEITTRHATRLLYEIVTRQAISPEASEKMEILLTRDLDPQAWKDSESGYWQFNPVRGFLGEGLPREVHFASKAGLTSTRRTEVAFVQSPDGATQYILAVFGEDSAYASQGSLFPQMSRLVYEGMTSKRKSSARN
jgi:beta-lactamase class A